MKLNALIKTVAVAGSFALLSAGPTTSSASSDHDKAMMAIQDAKAVVAKAKKETVLWGAPSAAAWGIKSDSKSKPYTTEDVLKDAEAAAARGDSATAIKLAEMAKFQAEKAMLQGAKFKDAKQR